MIPDRKIFPLDRYCGTVWKCFMPYIKRCILLYYLPSPQAWPSSPVCFSKAANTNLDTVSNRVSLLRDALSQSATKSTVQSVNVYTCKANCIKEMVGFCIYSKQMQTFANSVLMHVDPKAVGRFFRGTQSQIHQDTQVRMQCAVEGFLLLITRECSLQ